MKTKILSGLICCLGIFSANAQTITAPTGQALTITNAVDVTGGGLNILTNSEFKIGGVKVLSNKGTGNLFLGENTGVANTSGSTNVFIGASAGFANTTGARNLFLGSQSGQNNLGGSDNTFLGLNSGNLNTSGSSNIFIGINAGQFNQTGSSNLFVGSNTGGANTGNFNTLVGPSAGNSNTSGTNNTFLGYNSGLYNSSGSDNVYLGANAGINSGAGTTNVAVGVNSGPIGGVINTTSIGANATATLSNTVVLGNAATTITGQGLSAGVSGLRFANITSATSPGTGGSGKVLSVDATGNVILVGLTAGPITTNVGGPVAENWKESDGYLYNNSTNGVVIKGTGLDGNSLIVKGGVLSKEVNVKVEGSESWPDYVFKPNYKRMTLGEVEKFITINGHLPNIPSATEMAATGNNLGKTDVKLLEKVEELTLYLLEMKKANDAQAAELKALKQQVNKLRKK